jgi:hypothetical protein
MGAKKDATTEETRRLISRHPDPVETSRADSGRSTLSFQSVSHPERRVWLDTDLGGRLVIDLEDWVAGESWDNAVCHLAAPSSNVLAQIAVAWLTGRSLRDCKEIGGTEIQLR